MTLDEALARAADLERDDVITTTALALRTLAQEYRILQAVKNVLGDEVDRPTKLI